MSLSSAVIATAVTAGFGEATGIAKNACRRSANEPGSGAAGGW